MKKPLTLPKLKLPKKFSKSILKTCFFPKCIIALVIIERFLSNPCESEGCFISEPEHFTFKKREFFAFCLVISESGNFRKIISSKQSSNKSEREDWSFFSIPEGALIILLPPFLLGISNCTYWFSGLTIYKQCVNAEGFTPKILAKSGFVFADFNNKSLFTIRHHLKKVYGHSYANLTRT